MKKIAFLLLCILSQMASVQAFDIEARVAYLYPQHHRMRDVFGKRGWADLEVEGSLPLAGLLYCVSPYWDAWVNVSYYQKSGHST